MTVADFISDLQSDSRFSRCICYVENIPGRESEFGYVKDFPYNIADYLEKNNIRLFSHQCEAILALREGENIILSTSTASGKTLAFSLPVFERLFHDPYGSALYIYPTKALTRDQFNTLLKLESGTGIRINPGIYDGDTPRDKKPRIRDISRIVLTNPHELHHILSWHHLWSRFFSHLQFVIIDEAHRYRGVFGSNTSFLIRRLRRVCSHYGSDPRFVLSSATIANAQEFAGKLCGKEFRLISNDGSPHGQRNFVMYNPYREGNGSRTLQRETTALLLESIRRRLQVLCFTNSRKSTEVITLMAREMVARERLKSADKISAYRAGYLPEERKKIEQMLKCGDLMGVVSTNALEVGIDIGSLDGVILSGYPGTMTASWQQAGRSGRSGQDSFAILVAQPDPLDQYFMRNPQFFFNSTNEHAIIDLKNPYILSGQVLCAASELPISKEDDKKWFGDHLADLVDAQVNQKLLSETRRGFVYSGHRKAVDLVALSNISQDTFRIVCRGTTIETMDRSQAYREAHPGAVMLHQGDQYVVDDMDLFHHVVKVRPAEVDYYTKPLKSVDITVLDILKSHETGGITIFFGDVEVTECYTGYKIMKYDTILGVEPLDLPPLRFRTKALWFTVPPEIETQIRSQEMDFDGGLHGIEHAFIAMMPLRVMCDRWDIGGLSISRFGETQDAAVIVYDGYEGGIGLAEKAYDLFFGILSMTHTLVRDCSCAEGCPSCIYSPKCGNDNIPLDKEAAVAILGKLVLRFVKG